MLSADRSQWRVAFHGIHFGAEQRKQRRHVAGTGADFEHAIGRLQLEVLEHHSHDIRLRDSLSLANRQRMISIGILLESLSDKLMPRHAAHGVEHADVTDTALGKLRAHHFFALRPEIIMLER